MRSLLLVLRNALAMLVVELLVALMKLRLHALYVGQQSSSFALRSTMPSPSATLARGVRMYWHKLSSVCRIMNYLSVRTVHNGGGEPAPAW